MIKIIQKYKHINQFLNILKTCCLAFLYIYCNIQILTHMIKKSLHYSQEDKRIDIKSNAHKESLFSSKIANSKNSFARNQKIENEIPAYQKDSNFL